MGKDDTDRLGLSSGTRHFDASTTGWLLPALVRQSRWRTRPASRRIASSIPTSAYTPASTS